VVGQVAGALMVRSTPMLAARLSPHHLPMGVCGGVATPSIGSRNGRAGEGAPNLFHDTV